MDPKEEDEKLAGLVAENKSTPIPFGMFQSDLPGRDAKSMRNCWYCIKHRLVNGVLVEETLKTGRFTLEEDEIIAEHCMTGDYTLTRQDALSQIDWRLLASQTNRSVDALKQRWQFSLLCRVRVNKEGPYLGEPHSSSILNDELRNDPALCQKYLDSIPSNKLIKGDDPRMRGEGAGRLGCIEATFKQKYPSGYFRIDASRIDAELAGTVSFFGIPFCQAACTVKKWGASKSSL